MTNQAERFCSHAIADFIFSCEFHMALPYMDQLKIFDKARGGVGWGVNIIQFLSISVSFDSMYFFIWNLDVRASEKPSDSQVF